MFRACSAVDKEPLSFLLTVPTHHSVCRKELERGGLKRRGPEGGGLESRGLKEGAGEGLLNPKCVPRQQ